MLRVSATLSSTHAPHNDLVLGAGVAHALQMPTLVLKAIEPESSTGVSGGRAPSSVTCVTGHLLPLLVG